MPMDERLLLTLVAVPFGLVIGSFLNVCIVRWLAEASIFHPRRSQCPRCGTPIGARDNIPVFSWLLLGGKCRQCAEPISAMYPLVEVATGVIFAFAAWRGGASLGTLREALFLTILLGIAVSDAREYIIPDEFSLGGLGAGLLVAGAASLQGASVRPLVEAVVGAAAGFGLLWIVGALGEWILRKEAMGGGDIKMMAMVGSFVGWPGVLLTVFIGAACGTAIFLPLTLTGRRDLVPFGIFLAIGAAITLVAGPAIIDWYLHWTGLA